MYDMREQCIPGPSYSGLGTRLKRIMMLHNNETCSQCLYSFEPYYCRHMRYKNKRIKHMSVFKDGVYCTPVPGA